MIAYQFTCFDRTLRAEVSPTMETLGDQPWRVILFNEGSDAPLKDSDIIEAISGLEAACEAVDRYLKSVRVKDTTTLIKVL